MKKYLVLLMAFIFISILGIYNFTKVRDSTYKKIASIEGAIETGNLLLLLYYPDSRLNLLTAEERSAVYDKSLEKTIITELLKGPRYSMHENPFPRGTRLISVKRDRDIITVNLSREFKENHPGGTTQELNTIYSIVNSLTEIPGVRAVQFRINDKIEETLAGHMDISRPIERNRKLLTNYKKLKPDEVLKLQMDYESNRKWFEAYQLLADNYDNANRKYYNDYVNEMEEVYKLGFINKNYLVGRYALKDNNKAKVEVQFYTIEPDGRKRITNTVYFYTIMVDGEWMVDWSTVQ